jgi:hypothetical protein
MAMSKKRQAHLRALREAETKDTKLCSMCEKVLPLDTFTKENRNRKGKAARCRRCSQTARIEKMAILPETANRIKRQVEARGKEAEDTKACSVCSRLLPLPAFSKAKGKRKGRCAECKECRKEYKSQTREHNRWVTLYRLYGMTKEQFETTLKSQQGRCKICGTDTPGQHGVFVVDHCHETGKVRGLLCSRCNTSIGQMDHDPGKLQSAVKYLEEN